MRREDGFTLVELLVVVIVIAILLAIAIGFQLGARERAGDATARMNIRTAVPAIESYYADNNAYTGMTVGVLQSQYSAGVQGIAILSAGPSSYCVRASEAGRTWYKAGPSGAITTVACA